ncbi:MAG: hypothetical protein VKK04_12570 [Synechococcales bacterium]|nr:hypothetical protein [Synechococcales bacterium]
MAKHTQAHLSRTIEAGLPPSVKDMTKKKMEYYMGAKLLEVGVNPQTVIYRWSVEPKGDREVWTCSAYWGDSKDKILQEEQNS